MTWCLLEPYLPASASNFAVITGKADLLLSSFKAIPCFHGNLLGVFVTMGTWLLGLNTPYHHSIKKYGERGSLVVRETEFRSSPWEMCWEKGCAVGSLESMPHPIRFLLGWPHTHCADTMVCVCVWNCLSISDIWRTSLEGTLRISGLRGNSHIPAGRYRDNMVSLSLLFTL